MSKSPDAGRAVGTAAGALCLLAGIAAAVPVTIHYADGPSEGFNDPTLGAARREAWEFAVNHWAARLDGSQSVTISVSFDDLGTGDWVVVGEGGASYAYRDFPGAPKPRTWYDDPLANQFAKRDLSPKDPDIVIAFNSQIDTLNALGPITFHYGLDANVPPNRISFVHTALHELGHGFGFSPMIEHDTGSFPDNAPGAYDHHLVHGATTRTPLTSMSAPQRKGALTSNDLHFNGQRVVAAHGAPAPIYAPTTYYSGSSISHFDYGGFPTQQLMEPFQYGTTLDVGLALDVLADIGWTTIEIPRVQFVGRRLTLQSARRAHYVVSEGETASLRVSLSAPALTDTLLHFDAVAFGGAAEGINYAIETLSPVRVPAGASSVIIDVRTMATAEPNGDKSVEITLLPSAGIDAGEGPTTAVIRIQDTFSSVGDWERTG